MSLWNLFLVDEYPSYMALIMSQGNTHEHIQDMQMEDAGDASEDFSDLISEAPSIPETVQPTSGRGLLSDFDYAALTEKLVRIIALNPSLSSLLSVPLNQIRARTVSLLVTCLISKVKFV